MPKLVAGIATGLKNLIEGRTISGYSKAPKDEEEDPSADAPPTGTLTANDEIADSKSADAVSASASLAAAPKPLSSSATADGKSAAGIQIDYATEMKRLYGLENHCKRTGIRKDFEAWKDGVASLKAKMEAELKEVANARVQLAAVNGSTAGIAGGEAEASADSSKHLVPLIQLTQREDAIKEQKRLLYPMAGVRSQGKSMEERVLDEEIEYLNADAKNREENLFFRLFCGCVPANSGLFRVSKIKKPALVDIDDALAPTSGSGPARQ